MNPDPYKNPSPEFTKKAIESPILGSEFRETLSNSTNDTASSSDFKAFYQANKIYFWAIVAGIFLIGTLSFFAFRKKAPLAPGQANVIVSIDAPESVATGADAVYKIKVENRDSQKLVGLQLELAYPEGVTYTSSSPKADNISGSLFTVPDLISGQNAVVIVKAKATGNINDTKTLKAVIHYHYDNFSSEFTAEKDFSLRLIASDIMIQLGGPASTNNSQLVIYTITYQNNSSEDIKNARIRFNIPEGFNISSASPPSDLSNNIWALDSLAKGKEGKIEVRGTFNSVNPGESKTASADFLKLGLQGDYPVQNTSSFITSIANVPLLVTQTIQQENKDGVINPGDNLQVVIRYQNTASVPATGVNIAVNLDSKALDLSTLRAEGAQISNSSITWNASANSSLETVSPNELGTVSYSVRVKNPATKDSSKNLGVVSSVKIKSNEYQNPFPGGELMLKISSPSSVSSVLDYSAGAQPPQVGQTTTYRVTLTLRNATNDFSNALVTAFIPLGAGGFSVGSVTSAESGKVNYDSSTGKLNWNVGSLPAHTGQFTQPRTLQFTVTLNPSSSQVNQSPALVKTIRFSATDVYTGQSVQKQTDDITIRDVSGNNYNNQVVNP